MTTFTSRLKAIRSAPVRTQQSVRRRHPRTPPRIAWPARAREVIGKPSHFSGQRDNVFGTTVILTWDPISAASFYQLRAVGHQSGAAVSLGSDASDIADSQHRYVVDGAAAQVQGGVDYYLKACSAPGVCGGEAMVTVPTP
jgi:hypothetical protein